MSFQTHCYIENTEGLGLKEAMSSHDLRCLSLIADFYMIGGAAAIGVSLPLLLTGNFVVLLAIGFGVIIIAVGHILMIYALLHGGLQSYLIWCLLHSFYTTSLLTTIPPSVSLSSST